MEYSGSASLVKLDADLALSDEDTETPQNEWPPLQPQELKEDMATGSGLPVQTHTPGKLRMISISGTIASLICTFVSPGTVWWPSSTFKVPSTLLIGTSC